MRKTISIIVCIILIGAITGCGRVNKIANKISGNNPATTKETTANKDISGNTAAVETKLTKSDSKNIDDAQLIAGSKEQSTDLNDLSINEVDTSSLDSILNGTDPISDIPQSVELKK